MSYSAGPPPLTLLIRESDPSRSNKRPMLMATSGVSFSVLPS